MLNMCPNCNKLFKHGDHVRAVVLSPYRVLKSNVIRAIDTPYDCERIEHFDCYDTQRDEDEEA